MKPLWDEKISIDELKEEMEEVGWYLEVSRILPAFSEAVYEDHPNKYVLSQYLASMSPHQLASKAWLNRMLEEVGIDSPVLEDFEVKSEPVSLTVYGSWMGFGAATILEDIASTKTKRRTAKLHLVDIDTWMCSFSVSLMTKLGFNVETHAKRMEQIDVHDSAFTTRLHVNTAVEHMEVEQFKEWFRRLSESKTGKPRLLVLQGTDMPSEEHVTPIKSAFELTHPGGEFIPGLKRLIFEGALDFGDCSRFMSIAELW